MKKGAYVNFAYIYDVFKDYAGNSEFPEIEDLAEDVMTYGDLYTNITSDKKTLPESQKSLEPIFEEIRSLRMEVAYPF